MGHVRACQAGCVHVTYGDMTLNFPDREAFLQFTSYVCLLAAGNTEENVCVRHRWIVLCFHHSALREFAEMLDTAREALTADAPRSTSLLTGANGVTLRHWQRAALRH
jgi:hypothetical protein